MKSRTAGADADCEVDVCVDVGVGQESHCRATTVRLGSVR